MLLYHRVGVDPADPFGLCVAPDRFSEQMAALKSWGRVRPLKELLSACSTDSPPQRTVAITFDDGYFDNLQNALPILREHDVPATVFVTTGNPGQPFWWDLLFCYVAAANENARPLQFRLRGHLHQWRPAKLSSRRLRLLLLEVHRICSELTAEERALVLEQLSAGSERGNLPAGRALSRLETAELAGNPLITIGAHSVHHPRLARLGVDAQLRELQQSRSDLESCVGKPVELMSYPFGFPRLDYSRQTVRLASQAGYSWACAACAGVVHAKTERMEIPRYWVHNWRGEELLQRVKLWLN